jgi:hypothetical protein
MGTVSSECVLCGKSSLLYMCSLCPHRPSDTPFVFDNMNIVVNERSSSLGQDESAAYLLDLPRDP